MYNVTRKIRKKAVTLISPYDKAGVGDLEFKLVSLPFSPECPKNKYTDHQAAIGHTTNSIILAIYCKFTKSGEKHVYNVAIRITKKGT
ncbi:hypothetical protein P4679_24780 [Priestia megaterium]|uniref:hypothetical protein n=1 Tax=Priestia megaterium TaxID=1404 RepID=UPI002E22F58F|nr:hypothetical protein [Priestia megaterium]